MVPFLCCPVSRQCPWRKTLIEKKWLCDFYILHVNQMTFSLASEAISRWYFTFPLTFRYSHDRKFWLLVFCVDLSNLYFELSDLSSDLSYEKWITITSVLIMESNSSSFRLCMLCIDETKISACFNISTVCLSKHMYREVFHF